MDSQDASNLVAVHLVEALVECKAGATDLDIADFILTRWGVPPEDDQERTEVLGAIRDAVVLRRIVVTRQLRL